MYALIEAGADINLANNIGASPLRSKPAGSSGGGQRASQRASIDQAMKNGLTPLCIASQNDHLEVVRKLLKGGAEHTLARVDDNQRKETPFGIVWIRRGAPI